MEAQKLEGGSMLINKYSQAELEVRGFDEAKNRYDAVRVSDGKIVAVGINWWNCYEIKRD